MTQDADQTLPRLPLFVAERAAHIGEHKKLVRQAALPECAAAHFPAAPPRAPRKRQRVDSESLARETGRQPQTRCVPIEQLFRRAAEQCGAAAIDQSQRLLAIEGEDGDVDFVHDAAQQCGRLERVEALRPHVLAEAVQLEKQQPERVFGVRTARAQGVVALAQRGEHVRDGLERTDDAFPHDHRADEPDGDHQAAQCPLDPRRKVAEP